MKYNKDDLIKKLIAHEGLRLDVYKDTLGINTIGIGRNLDDRGISKEELDWMDYPSIDYVFSDGITEADAMYLAQNDVQIVEEELVRAHPCVEELDAVRQLVLVDMAFNLGVPRLCKFKKNLLIIRAFLITSDKALIFKLFHNLGNGTLSDSCSSGKFCYVHTRVITNLIKHMSFRMVKIVFRAMSGRDLFKGIIFVHHSHKKFFNIFTGFISVHEFIV